MNPGSAADIGPILVLDAWERMALGAVRALGQQGIEVAVGGHDAATDYAARSRYVRRYHHLPDPTGPADQYEQALHAVVRDHGYAAIVPVHDATLARLASIDLPAPTISRLDDAWFRLQDKLALGELVMAAGGRYPETRWIETPDEAEAAVEELGAPVFVKSPRSAVATAERVPFQRGAVRADTPSAARTAAERLFAEGLPAIAQASIDRREKFSIAVVRHEGRSEMRYATRVLREHPKEGGIGMTLEAIDPDSGDGDEAITMLERVCDQVDYEGVAQAEAYRGGDGLLYLFDVNPRVWGSVWFAELLGVRPFQRALRAALGLPGLPPARYEVGRHFHTFNGEVAWVRSHEQRGRAALGYLMSLRPTDRWEYLQFTDLRPNAGWALERWRRAKKR